MSFSSTDVIQFQLRDAMTVMKVGQVRLPYRKEVKVKRERFYWGVSSSFRATTPTSMTTPRCSIMNSDIVRSLYCKLKEDFPRLPQNLRDEQVSVLVELLKGKDCVAVLPTGFGKSLIYTIYPLLYSRAQKVSDFS
jgi:superfamily II DNA helicase RecQ